MRPHAPIDESGLECEHCVAVERDQLRAEVERLNRPENRGIGDGDMIAALNERDQLRARVAELETALESMQAPLGLIAEATPAQIAEQVTNTCADAARLHKEKMAEWCRAEALTAENARLRDELAGKRKEGSKFVPEDDMCPNCVTPWKCNGPHLVDLEDYRDDLAEMAAQLTATRAALRRYGRHEHLCSTRAKSVYINTSCNCGLDAALDGTGGEG